MNKIALIIGLITLAYIIMNKHKRDPLLIVALTIFGEARGINSEGKIAVANVIKNRVDSGIRWWGSDYISVCLKPYQFSCWNPNDPNRAYLLAIEKNENEVRGGEHKAWQECKAIATKLLTNQLIDNTGGATHYHTPQVTPAWKQGATVTVATAEHIFYNNVA